MSSNGKTAGGNSRGLPSSRAEDVERLIAKIRRSPSPENTGAVVLEHVADYDDEFFEAPGELIAREEAHLRRHRVRTLEELRDYLRHVRRRVSEGQLDKMWDELARGAAQDETDPRASAKPSDSREVS
jgi:hypothetical protein